LIALDCGNYNMPENTDAKIQATRKMYINYILEKQTSDGGWALSGDIADPDITGMALQALSKYQDDDKVKSAISEALMCLSDMQDENGGFSSCEAENSESSVQVIVALCELGIPVDDERFVKYGRTILDNLLTFYDNERGFKHTYDTKTNQMATEQCFYALVALKRASENKNSLYNMSDAISIENSNISVGLAGKNEDIKKMEIIHPEKTFTDIGRHRYKTAIEALASRGIINGKNESNFEPNSTMTRAEFATIIVRGLGLPEKSNSVFRDVTTNDWFYSYVNTAYSYGIIKGVSEGVFEPEGTVSREEAAVMVARAARLCGMNTDMDALLIRDVLAQFFDYVNASDWSQSSLAFCYSEGVLSDEVMDIKPKEAVTRAEIADMLYNMLSVTRLL
ncbi:MAG: S-layer homology domain-containing protein, partial [Clostridia bacterium]|nr:S-layer homology domain-containing protein [Clostridia bacterium]